MDIRKAELGDFEFLAEHDRHIQGEILKESILSERVYVIESSGNILGWMRYNLFWDSIPFMNMLYILDGSRGMGYGKAVIERWESDMSKMGYKTVMTSTQSDEYAQHFYTHLGYTAIGSFNLGSDPMEIIFSKTIGYYPPVISDVI